MIVQGQTTIFKQNLLSGLENFAAGTTYTYNIALYDALANLDNSTTEYTTTNEISGTGYSAGGQALTIIVPNSSTTDNTAWVSFQNAEWTSASFTCRGALIYNATTNAAVAVLNFGSDKTVTNGTFTVQFPTANATNAIIRIA
jgi:hypothetical protein